MIDRDKVIKGLDHKLNGKCSGCPYDEEFNCIGCEAMLKDARNLLMADQAQLVEQRKRLETITDIAYDYDGYKTEEDLKALIDEMRDIALRGVPEDWRADDADD